MSLLRAWPHNSDGDFHCYSIKTQSQSKLLQISSALWLSHPLWDQLITLWKCWVSKKRGQVATWLWPRPEGLGRSNGRCGAGRWWSPELQREPSFTLVALCLQYVYISNMHKLPHTYRQIKVWTMRCLLQIYTKDSSHCNKESRAPGNSENSPFHPRQRAKPLVVPPYQALLSPSCPHSSESPIPRLLTILKMGVVHGYTP